MTKKLGRDVTDVVYNQKEFKGLPREYEFREDEDFLYIYKNDRLIGVYNSRAVDAELIVEDLLHKNSLIKDRV